MSKDYRYHIIDFLNQNKQLWEDISFWRRFFKQTKLSETTAEVALRIVNKRKLPMKILPDISEQDMELLFAGCTDSCFKWLMFVRQVIVEGLQVDNGTLPTSENISSSSQQQPEENLHSSESVTSTAVLSPKQQNSSVVESSTVPKEHKSIEESVTWNEMEEDIADFTLKKKQQTKQDAIVILVRTEDRPAIINKLETLKLPTEVRFSRKSNSTNGEWIEQLDKVIKRGTLSSLSTWKLIVWSSFESDRDVILQHQWCLIGDWADVKNNLWIILRKERPDIDGNDQLRLLSYKWTNESLRQFNSHFLTLADAARHEDNETLLDLWISKLPETHRLMMRHAKVLQNPDNIRSAMKLLEKTAGPDLTINSSNNKKFTSRSYSNAQQISSNFEKTKLKSYCSYCKRTGHTYEQCWSKGNQTTSFDGNQTSTTFTQRPQSTFHPPQHHQFKGNLNRSVSSSNTHGSQQESTSKPNQNRFFQNSIEISKNNQVGQKPQQMQNSESTNTSKYNKTYLIETFDHGKNTISGTDEENKNKRKKILSESPSSHSKTSNTDQNMEYSESKTIADTDTLQRETVQIEDKVFDGIVDSASESSFITSSILSTLKETVKEGTIRVKFAEDKNVHTRELIKTTITVNGKIFNNYPLGVLQSSSFEVIIGRDLIRLSKLKIDLNDNEEKFHFKPIEQPSLEDILSHDISAKTNGNIYHPDANKLLDKINSHIKANLANRGNEAKVPPFKIPFKNPNEKYKHHWVRQPPMSVTEEQQFQKQVEEWAKDGIVRELDDRPNINSGRFNTRFFGVRQKLGKVRIVGDFVHLNKLLSDDTNHLPIIDEELQALGSRNGCIISKIDLRGSFLQCPVDKDDQYVLAFSCRINGQWKRYCFNRIPFGLKQIPSWFHQIISSILQMSESKASAHFVDDIWVVTEDNMDYHADEVIKVLDALTEASLVINEDKCTFGATQVLLLGFLVTGHGLKLDKDRVLDMLSWKRPTTKKTLQKFLGFINYSRRFIPNCAEKLDIFYSLLNVNQFEWTENLEKRYKEIYECLVNSGMLHFFTPSATIEMRVDASDTSLGCHIVQHRDGKTEDLVFNSRKLSSAERKYSIPKKELLSAVFFMKKYEDMLRHRQFDLRMDNAAIATLLDAENGKSSNDKTLDGWIAAIREFDFKVIPIKGKDNTMADILSRVQMVSNVKDNNYSTVEGKNKSATIIIDPNSLTIDEIIEHIHRQGHFGEKVMLRYIENYLHIHDDHLQSKIRKVTSSCLECAKINAGKLQYAPQEFNKNIDEAMKNVYVDFMQMIKSKSGMNYVIVAIDYFTKFVWLKALESKNSEEQAAFLEAIMLQFGRIGTLSSDDEFNNYNVKSLCEDWNTNRRVALAYNHQAMGPVERANRTVRETLLKTVKDKLGDLEHWDELVPLVQFWMNSKFNEVSKCTPFDLMFMRSPLGSMDINEDEITENNSNSGYMEINRAYLMSLIKANVLESKMMNFELNQLNTSQKQFRVGDEVMAIDNRRQTKCADRYIGPMEVTTATNEGNHQLRHDDGFQEVRPTPQLKRYHPSRRGVPGGRGVRSNNSSRSEHIPYQALENLNDEDIIIRIDESDPGNERLERYQRRNRNLHPGRLESGGSVGLGSE